MKIALDGVMRFHARDIILPRLVSHRVICSCVVSAKEKCILYSGQSLVRLAVVHFSYKPARLSFLSLMASSFVFVYPPQGTNRQPRIKRKPGLKFPRKACSHLSAHFPHRPHDQKVRLRPSTRTTLSSTCNRCMRADGGFLRSCRTGMASLCCASGLSLRTRRLKKGS